MTPPEYPKNPFREAGARVRTQASRLLSHGVVRNGAAGAAVAIAAIIALTAILVKVASEDTRPPAPRELHAVAQIVTTNRWCALEPAVRTTATACTVVGRNQVQINFRTSLVGSTAIVSPACCPGEPVAASVVSDRVVTVGFPRLCRRQTRASIFVP